MHDWSEDTFDWNSLNEAIDYMHDYMVKYGRIGVHSKEKWGTARLYVTFYHGSLHSLTHPGYVYSQYPKWLWTADIYYISPFCRKIGLASLIQWWQTKVYVRAYANAVKKWPHIKKEITCAADHYDLLKLNKVV
jgi:hypothetical protein